MHVRPPAWSSREKSKKPFRFLILRSFSAAGFFSSGLQLSLFFFTEKRLPDLPCGIRKTDTPDPAKQYGKTVGRPGAAG
jgi:hypothetical protein